MLKQLIKFYHISTPATPLKKDKKKLKRLQWATFLSATAGYGIYYVCRLSLNVVKKPIVEEGIFSETELGIIGAVLFFTYAIGKFTNGFLADRSNIRRFMSTGLLITALANLCLGFTHSFILFAILWGISGWFQSMGAASCVVGLSRWFENKKRGQVLWLLVGKPQHRGSNDFHYCRLHCQCFRMEIRFHWSRQYRNNRGINRLEILS